MMSTNNQPSFAQFFDQLERGEASAALRMVEGDKVKTKRISLPFIPLEEQLNFAGAFIDCDNGTLSVHGRLLRAAAMQIAHELTKWVDWVNQALAPAAHSIKLYFEDGHVLDASVQESGSYLTAERTTVVWIGLGSIPLLFGIANRLAVSEQDAAQSGMTRSADYFEHSKFETWRPEADPLGTLEFDLSGTLLNRTYQIAMDASVLMFLHEVTHASQGHTSLKELKMKCGNNYNRYRRAAEGDADWGAGWLFVRGHEYFRECPSSETSIVSRLAYAGQCHYLSFQHAYWSGNNAGQLYHLPLNRQRCTYRGGKQAWIDFGGNAIAFYNAYMDAVIQMPVVELLAEKSIPHWMGAGDRRVGADFNEFQTVSLPLIYEITKKTAGVRSSPWMPARQPPKSKDLLENLLRRV